MDIAGESSPEQWKCEVCDTSYTDKSYYDKHVGTKKHKRNLRTARKAIYEPETVQCHPMNSCDFNGTRENYRQKNNKPFEDYYTSYVSSTITYWAINLCLNPTVQDFRITIYDKKWDDFGDAVVEIQFKELPGKPSSSVRYAVHFKYISPNAKHLDSFSEGKFSVDGIARQIGKIKDKPEQEIEDTRFIIFTTSIPSPTLKTALTLQCCQCCFKSIATCGCSKEKGDSECKEEVVYARPLSNRRNVILNTSEDNESVYRFYPRDNSYRLPQIYVYSCQKKLRAFPDAIEEIVFNSFGYKPEELARNSIKYVENWGQGKCGGFYKLQKEDMLLKLGQLFLAHLTVTPQAKIIEGPEDRFTTWIEAVKSVDVTVLKPSADLSKLLEPFSLLIEKELANKINTTPDTVTIVRTKEQDDIKKVENTILRSFLLEETLKESKNELPLEKVYLIFWKAGLMPLILQVKNEPEQNYSFQIVNRLKKFGLTRRYLIHTIHGNIHTADIKTLKHISVFVNLSDISAEIWHHLQIGVTEDCSITLAEIEESDEFFKRSICASELFDMILGKYLFKPYCYRVDQRESEEITKLTLSNELMTKFKREIQSRSELNNALIREWSRSDFPKNWLRGIKPDLFSVK